MPTTNATHQQARRIQRVGRRARFAALKVVHTSLRGALDRAVTDNADMFLAHALAGRQFSVNVKVINADGSIYVPEPASPEVPAESPIVHETELVHID